MGKIVTVLGELAPEHLGFCQSHEHLCILKGHSWTINPVLCIDDKEKSQAELCDYRQAGGAAVVDAQPVGCGRDGAFLQEISKRSGVHIIASTGFHKLGFYPEDHWLKRWNEDQLAALFSSELTKGMFAPCDTVPPARQIGARAGQIKTALDSEGLTPRYVRLFRGAARAARMTGAPLMVHVESGADPIALADFFQGEGLDLEQLIFCHLDRAVPDFEVHLALCRRGITLEYDTVARPKYHGDEQEAQLVLSLLSAGFGDRLLMSLDVTRARLLRYGGEVGLDYIRRTFLPLLRERGVTEGQLHKIFVTNPARAFAWRQNDGRA